jgi:hypothetical protein
MNLTAPPELRKLTDNYKDLFVPCGISCLELLAFFGMFAFFAGSLSAVVRAFPWVRSVSTLGRGVNQFQPNRAMRRMLGSVQRRLEKRMKAGDEFIFAIDDTSNPRFSKNCAFSGTFGGSGGVYFGQKILVVALVNLKTAEAIPIWYEFCTKKNDPNHVPAPERAIDALEYLKTFGLPVLPVALDSWFDSSLFFQGLKRIGFNAVVEIKAKRRVRHNPGRHVCWTKLSEFFKTRYRAKTEVSWLKGTSGSLRGMVLSKNTPPSLKSSPYQILKRGFLSHTTLGPI